VIRAASNDKTSPATNIIKAITERVPGGTVNLKGKEVMQSLRHSALGNTEKYMVEGKVLHASHGTDAVDFCGR
jgi:hypothetical protein